MPGGDLAVELGDTVRLGGPVVHVFDVDVDARRAASAHDAARTKAGSGGGSPRPRSTSSVVRQRALLVGTGIGTRDVEDAEASLDELALLVDTAGADAVELVLQRRDAPDPATYIGKGKAEELRELGRGARRRHRRVRRRAHARRSSATSRSCSASTSSTAPR